MLCSSCSSKNTEPVTITKYEYLIPNKLPVPSKPELYKYDTSLSVASPVNFKRIQQNTIFLIDYANSLKSVITAYEKEIDNLTAIKNKASTDK